MDSTDSTTYDDDWNASTTITTDIPPGYPVEPFGPVLQANANRRKIELNSEWKGTRPSNNCYGCEKEIIKVYKYCLNCPMACRRFCTERCFIEVHSIAGNHTMFSEPRFATSQGATPEGGNNGRIGKIRAGESGHRGGMTSTARTTERRNPFFKQLTPASIVPVLPVLDTDGMDRESDKKGDIYLDQVETAIDKDIKGQNKSINTGEYENAGFETFELDPQTILELGEAYSKNTMDLDRSSANEHLPETVENHADQKKLKARDLLDSETISQLFSAYLNKVMDFDKRIEEKDSDEIPEYVSAVPEIKPWDKFNLGQDLDEVADETPKRPKRKEIQKRKPIRPETMRLPGMKSGIMKPKTDIINIVNIKAEEPQKTTKLMSITCDAAVKCYNSIQERRTYMAKVTRVVSPSEFFIELVMGGCYMEKPWFTELQEFYNDPDRREQYKIKTEVFKLRSYVIFDTDSNLWQRVRVYKVKPELQRANVYFCDLGRSQWVSWEELLEQKPKFAAHHGFAFACSLADLGPPNGEEEWPQVSTDVFRDMVEGKIFHTIVVTRTDSHSILGSPDCQVNMSVVLIRKDPSAKYPVQAELVKLGLAKSADRYFHI